MRKYFLFISVLSLTIFNLEIAFSASAKVKPLMAPRVVQSSLTSVDAAYRKMYVSHPLKTIDTSLSQVVEFGADLTMVEVSAIKNLIESKTDPSRKKIVFVRYELADMRMAEVLVEAKKKGISVEIITDLNPSFKGKFSEGEKYSFDFKNADPVLTDDGKKTPGALVIEYLLANGFDFEKEGSGIYSQPLFPQDKSMKPIMHEKALILIDEKDGAQSDKTVFHGTANLTPNPRYNRTYEIVDPLVVDDYFDHAKALQDTFRSHKLIKDIPSKPPFRIIYKDGSYQEIAYTDGKFNPNERIIKYYLSLVNQNLETAPKRVGKLDLHAQFVFTNKEALRTLTEALKANNQMQFFGVFDDRFLDLYGYGLAPALVGFDIYSEFGKGAYGLQTELLARIHAYAYQKRGMDPVTGKERKEPSVEGPPIARDLMHDKTHIGLYEENQKLFYMVHTGSLNCSNHFDNAEVQFEINAPESSLLARAIVASIRGVIEEEKEFAVPMVIGVLRNTLGLITGHTDLEVPLPMVNSLGDELKKANFTAVIATLKELSLLPSDLIKRPTLKEVNERIGKLEAFLNWFQKEVPGSNTKLNSRLRKFAGLSLVLGVPELSFSKQRFILNSIIWDSETDQAQMDLLTLKGLEVLGVKPEPKFIEISAEAKKAVVVSVPGQITGFSFDWDDNVMVMPTKIILFQKKTKKELGVSTGMYAKIREKIGKPSEDPEVKNFWEDFEIDYNPMHGSYRNFREGPGGLNYFADDIKFAIENQRTDVWQGPSFKTFIQALSTPESARYTSINTARGHPPEEVIEGLTGLQEYLKSQGVTIYLPPIENIHTVGGADNPSMAKVERMRKDIANIAKNKLDDKNWHTWGFSDDDWGNFQTALRELSKDIAQKRWPNVKIVLFYTGPSVANEEDIYIMSLRPDGTVHKILKSEVDKPDPCKDALLKKTA